MGQINVKCHSSSICFSTLVCYKYRLYTEVKVSMGFINRATIVARLINAIETVLRCITHFYHAKRY